MLDPIVNFFTRIFQWIGRGIGFLIGIILWPFMWAGRWYTQRGWILKLVFGVIVLGLVGLYAYFFWTTQAWRNFDPNYPDHYKFEARHFSAGEVDSAAAAANKSCAPSAIVQVEADLTDFNVNQNPWVSSMLLYKLGFFGLDWDATPFFDNKASFQRGINQAVRNTAFQLKQYLGRERGTSEADPDLSDAQGQISFDEYTWYFGANPFGPKTPTPSFYRISLQRWKTFNDRLEACKAAFDPRADNLIQLLDAVANDIGSTSASLEKRSANFNNGWFDTRADNYFWFAYGQLYGYYGLMAAARADFDDVLRERHLDKLWDQMLPEFQGALRIQPAIISNGREDGWIMPSHLTTMGFYVLRVNKKLSEMRDVLKQ
jgi:hypothetical protein